MNIDNITKEKKQEDLKRVKEIALAFYQKQAKIDWPSKNSEISQDRISINELYTEGIITETEKNDMLNNLNCPFCAYKKNNKLNCEDFCPMCYQIKYDCLLDLEGYRDWLDKFEYKGEDYIRQFFLYVLSVINAWNV